MPDRAGAGAAGVRAQPATERLQTGDIRTHCLQTSFFFRIQIACQPAASGITDTEPTRQTCGAVLIVSDPSGTCTTSRSWPCCHSFIHSFLPSHPIPSHLIQSASPVWSGPPTTLLQVGATRRIPKRHHRLWLFMPSACYSSSFSEPLAPPPGLHLERLLPVDLQ